MELDILKSYENYYTSKLNLKWGGKTNFLEKIKEPCWDWEVYVDVSMLENSIIIKSNGELISIKNSIYHNLFNYFETYKFIEFNNINVEKLVEKLENITIKNSLKLFNKNEPLLYKQWLKNNSDIKKN